MHDAGVRMCHRVRRIATVCREPRLPQEPRQRLQALKSLINACKPCMTSVLGGCNKHEGARVWLLVTAFARCLWRCVCACVFLCMTAAGATTLLAPVAGLAVVVSDALIVALLAVS
jgi:hypothetical protein